MNKLQESKNRLASLEDEVAKISAQFASHVEAQTRAMEDEKIRQHKNVAERRRRAMARRNKKGGAHAPSRLDSATPTSSATQATEAKLRTMCEEVNQSLDKARQRLAVGRPWEEQYRSLVADIKQVVAHNNALANSGPSRISAPNVTVERPRLTLGMPGMTASSGSDADKTKKRERLLRKLDELDGKESKSSKIGVRPPLPP
jgi:hypothetical protein